MKNEKKQWIAPEATEMEVNTGGPVNSVENATYSS